VPAGDVDFVDDEAQEGLFLGEVEGVEHVEDPGGEVTDAVTQLVVAGELVSLRGEGVAAFGEVAAAVFDVGGAALQLGQLDEAGLVEVDEAAAFGVGGVELAVQSGQLGGEQFVIGGRVRTARACSPAVSTSGRSSAARTWSKTNASRASERMLRSVQRRSGPPALIGSWLRQ
jgi:hypothetical protein